MVFVIDHGVFCEKPRSRIYDVGAKQSCGGAKAISFIPNVVDCVINLRRMSEPTTIVPDIVNVDSVDEAARRAVSKVGLRSL